MFDYGGDDRSYQRGDLKVCIGHKAMVGVPATDDYVECTLHHINVTCDDTELEAPVVPVAFLPHSCNEWVIGGRDELLALREDIDAALEYVI